MTVRKLIETLKFYADRYGDDIPVRTFDLDRDVCDISEVDFSLDYNSKYFIYIG